MITDIKVNRPEPIFPEKPLRTFQENSNVGHVINALEGNNQIVVTDYYSNGLVLLKALKMHLRHKFPNKTFEEQGAARAEYRKLSNLILLEIVDHKLLVEKAPSIGWLEKFYPETENFLLPFPQVQGLNSSWQWYKNGISIPVLKNKVHPYYSSYFPTRFDHLVLFDKWLRRYAGPKKSAIDVGCGCGILSMQLVNHGFEKVYGTDINPNAIVGLEESIADSDLAKKIELDFAPLFGKFEQQSELIIFNPPWLPVSHVAGNMDNAIFYDDHLFPDFFAAAKDHLLPDGKLLLLFSNLAQISNEAEENPIEKELTEGGRFKLVNCFKRDVKAASRKTKRNLSRRSSEVVQLWVLTHM